MKQVHNNIICSKYIKELMCIDHTMFLYPKNENETEEFDFLSVFINIWKNEQFLFHMSFPISIVCLGVTRVLIGRRKYHREEDCLEDWWCSVWQLIKHIFFLIVSDGNLTVSEVVWQYVDWACAKVYTTLIKKFFNFGYIL